MRILAVITEPKEVKKILRHLVKVGRPPAGIPAKAGAGSKLRVIANLYPCPFRGMSMSPQHSLSFPKAKFIVLSDRRSSQERQLLLDLLCVAEDERQSCLDRLDGHQIRRLARTPRIIKSTIISQLDFL
jgi:hypothetical protein